MDTGTVGGLSLAVSMPFPCLPKLLPFCFLFLFHFLVCAPCIYPECLGKVRKRRSWTALRAGIVGGSSGASADGWETQVDHAVGHWHLPVSRLCGAAALGTVFSSIFHHICGSRHHFSGVYPAFKGNRR